MSCWVVPTVAADYWGITLDVVWRRLCDGLVPHKTEQGFVFIDVDPWAADSDGNSLHHSPPCTFVPAGEEISLEQSILIDALESEEIELADWNQARPSTEAFELIEAESLLSDDWNVASGRVRIADDELEPAFASTADAEDDRGNADQDSGVEDELPHLDEEEAATFGRLSWQEVRSQVSRTRRPPPSRA
jgi:hypothetical protein